ncbi:YHS domain-containing (seleno)protein [Marinomonas mediterranea]|uniref:YHS domain-containing (seleno)protein n=1 Tax=Marinomonas mediterranea TaxID=119864 RepID=UPI00234ACC66|nr:YHS domain-containing (seleno)protein [Marinomonas mediterranea]WCN07607.1 hypothetical protein GV055_01035 [Marinomonas mediterranea]
MRGLILSLVLLFPLGLSASEPVSTSYWSNTAIGGHDTTAYHQVELDRPSRLAEGSPRFTVKWNGAEWHFASQASADKFSTKPAEYAPSYNGFCANALSLGEGKIRTDGTVWEFFGDKLYLFYAERGRQRWLNGDWQQYKAQADTAWADIILGR